MQGSLHPRQAREGWEQRVGVGLCSRGAQGSAGTSAGPGGAHTGQWRPHPIGNWSNAYGAELGAQGATLVLGVH
jgi:hypothetical protein